MRLIALALLMLALDAKAGIIRQDVRHFSKSGGTGLIGDVTISEGTNVTLTQSGQNIAISSSVSGLPSPSVVTTTNPYTVTSTTDLVFAQNTTITLLDCTTLGINKVWSVMNTCQTCTSGVTVRPGGANVFQDNSTTAKLTDPNVQASFECTNGGSTINVY